MYSGWELTIETRREIYRVIRPIYKDTFPQALTYQFRTSEMPTATKGLVVGSHDNKEGQQYIIFEIDGSTYRHDGNVLALSWSRDHGLIGQSGLHSGHPAVSNDCWIRLDQPITVPIEPRLFD